MVPPDLKEAVYEAVKRRGKVVDETWAEWWRAQAQAEAAVMRKLGHPDLMIDRKLDHEMAFADQLEARARSREQSTTQIGLDLGDSEG